jgi:hypothetical protein
MSASAILTTRPFAEMGLALAERRLAVIPCPGDDGKSPRGAVSGYHLWKKPPGPDRIQRFAAEHGGANIGIIPSLSGLTVADVDEGGKDAEAIIRRAGDTPLIIRTPSGGVHLYYRSNGERSANLRPDGLAVDVKGSSAGIVIVPPSYRPSTGISYRFERGTWDDLDCLHVPSPAVCPCSVQEAPARNCSSGVASGITNCSRPHFAKSVIATISPLLSMQLQR